MAPDAVSTTKWSGLTAPDTTASPSPELASITASRRLPVTGLAVNITPAASASTMRWTTTARATVAGSMFRLARYATARSVHSEAQHFRTASSSATASMTFR
jgi:hypothetical protein